MENLSSEIKTETHSETSKCEAGITPPSLRDKYTLIREIGHGTQGRIYLAKRNEDDIEVAIKQLNIESVKTWKEYDLFRREANVLASLDIQGIAQFYEAIECLDDDPPCAYIVQEYIRGQSLAAMIKAGHRFALNRVYDIILQLLKILDQLQKHDPPIVHRDIKPSNIMLKPLDGDDFEVYLIDFGAVANPQIQSGGSTVAGTFGYMAPEQMMGKPEPASDIYSLGAVAVHLISGRSPAEMPVKDFHLIFEPDMQNMPPALVTALRRMLDPNAAGRLCDIEVLSELFKAFSESIYSSQTHFNDKSLSNEEFEKRLKQVEYYGQEGNIELWQRLPDETPRVVPKDVLTQTFSSEKEQYIFPAVNYSCKFESKGSNKLIIMCIIAFFMAVVSQIFIFRVFKNEIDWESKAAQEFEQLNKSHWPEGEYQFKQHLYRHQYISKHKDGWLILVMIPFIPYFILIVIARIRWESTPDRSERKSSKKIVNKKIVGTPFRLSLFKIRGNLFINSHYVQNRINELFHKGRKTIATVVEIKYLNFINANIEIMDTKKPESHSCNHVCHGRPTFAISYKFNPPDDAREEDIVHAIITHTDAFNYLKIGDPLPILYYILRDEDNIVVGDNDESIEYVISMPFPYPLTDPVTPTDIYFGDRVRVQKILETFENEHVLSALSKERTTKAASREEQPVDDAFMTPEQKAESTEVKQNFSSSSIHSSDLDHLFDELF